MSSVIRENNISGMLASNILARQFVDPNLLVRTHMRLVERIARSIHAKIAATIPVEDLVQVGLIALLESARVFEDRGVAKFTTYAACRIRGAMIDDLRRQATISRQALRDRRTFAALTDKLAGGLGRRPSDSDMAQALGIEVTAYRKAAAATSTLRFQSIDAVASDSSSWFADTAPNAFDNLQHDQMQTAIETAIDELPEVEGKVVQLYFIEEMSLDDIGDMLGVTGTRICHIKKKAVERIRRKLTGWA
jgi:RNA polymerase sigma factor for flagellar operon FliA